MQQNLTWRPARVPIYKPVASASNIPEEIFSIDLSPDGSQIAIFFRRSQSSIILDVRSLVGITEINADSNGVYSSDGKRLATFVGNKPVIFETTSWTQVQAFQEQSRPPQSVAISPTGDILTTGHHRKIYCWDIVSGQLIRELDHSGVVTSLAFSPDGLKLASRSEYEMAVWDVSTGAATFLIEPNRGWGDVIFGRDGKSILSGKDRECFAIWNLDGTERAKIIDSPTRLSFTCAASSDQSLIAYGRNDDRVELINPSTRESSILSGPSSTIRNIRFSSDGKTLAVASATHVQFWTTDETSACEGTPLNFVDNIPPGEYLPQLGLNKKEEFFDRVTSVPWFQNVGKAIRGNAPPERLEDWYDWEGIGDPQVENYSFRFHSWLDDLKVGIRTFHLHEVDQLFEQVKTESSGAAQAALSYEPEDDTNDPISACIYQAGLFAGMMACYIHMSWPIPAELISDWQWFEAGHWPCGNAVY